MSGNNQHSIEKQKVEAYREIARAVNRLANMAQSLNKSLDDLNKSSPSISERIEEFKEKEKRDREEHLREVGAQGCESANKQLFRRHCMPYLKKMSVKEYAKWLYQYMKAGGQPTHWCGDRMADAVFPVYKATKSFEIVPLHGANAVTIVVPEHLKVTGNKGHNEVLQLEYDEDEKPGPVCEIPLYRDVEKHIKKMEKKEMNQ